LEAGSRYKILHAFSGKPDGGGVYAGLAIDNQGSLYGTTCCGGAYGYGTVFELTPSSGGKWTETILHNFCKDFPRCKDGALPSTTPVLDSAGNVYGTSNSATFEMKRKADGWSFLVLCDCVTPSVFDAAGNLYGIGGPGTHNAGAVAELSPGADGWKETLLYSFCSWPPNCRDGEPPEWGLSWDAAGNLYGTTEFGGDHGAPECNPNCGVVYQLQALGGGDWKYHRIHSFAASANDGVLPQYGVTVDPKGNVYGTTLYSVSTSGTVYELSPQQDGQWKETILYNFPNPEKYGGAPAGGVTFDNLGNLYGTASAGGDPNCDCGVVFKMTPQANGKWSYTVLHRFQGTDGVGPGYNLIFDKDYKHLYGTTVEGGYGVVYEITP
jgi:uncharacterized repeat protein (TIGR03803 family)